MDKIKFEELLNNSNNRLELFRNKGYLNECGFEEGELTHLIYIYLDDDEKVRCWSKGIEKRKREETSASRAQKGNYGNSQLLHEL